MKAILKQLYDGEIYPAEQFYPKVKEYKALRRKNFVHYESFTKKLETISPELSQEFTQIMDEQLSAIPLERECKIKCVSYR